MKYLPSLIVLLTILYSFNQLDKRLDAIEQKVNVVQIQVLAVHKYIAETP